MSIEPKPGMILFYEPDDLEEIYSIEQAKAIDTACFIIDLGGGAVGYVPLAEAIAHNYTFDDALKKKLAIKADLFNWYATQYSAICKAYERQWDYHSKAMYRLRQASTFLFSRKHPTSNKKEFLDYFDSQKKDPEC